MKRLSIGAAAASAAILMPASSAFAHWGDDGYYMHHMGFGGGIFGSFVMLLIFGLIIVAVVWVIRGVANSSVESSTHSRALEILNERYAKGEIDKSEFEERKQALGK